MILLRNYHAGDAAVLAALFTETVHAICARDYSPAQLGAWAPRPPDLKRWQERLDVKRPIVATLDEEVVGFAELDPNGLVDCFYVHADYQRRGVGRALLREIEERALAAGIRRLHAEVSHTARPFFAHHGFVSRGESLRLIVGVKLSNWLMDKDLAAPLA